MGPLRMEGLKVCLSPCVVKYLEYIPLTVNDLHQQLQARNPAWDLFPPLLLNNCHKSIHNWNECCFKTEHLKDTMYFTMTFKLNT